ncbi:MAG TPA: ABC transporter permease [Solirubrobacterales bacterium]|nr:ABC transporter permease [Solirubrobacterales bacterium]
MLLHFALPLGSVVSSFSDAIDFILHPQPAQTGGTEVGGFGYIWPFLRTHLEVSGLALAGSLAVSLPVGLWLGHRGRGEFFAVALGNAGRALPELALIAFLAAFIGVGLRNVTIALMVLGIPPILTNTFVAVRQVDPDAVQAARGMGMRGAQVLARVELPLAASTIMSGVRTAAINIVATATIAPLAGVSTLGEFILGRDVYGTDGVLAGAILVALLALIVELTLAGLQWLLTPRGLALQRTRAAA